MIEFFFSTFLGRFVNQLIKKSGLSVREKKIEEKNKQTST